MGERLGPALTLALAPALREALALAVGVALGRGMLSVTLPPQDSTVAFHTHTPPASSATVALHSLPSLLPYWGLGVSTTVWGCRAPPRAQASRALVSEAAVVTAVTRLPSTAARGVPKARLEVVQGWKSARSGPQKAGGRAAGPA